MAYADNKHENFEEMTVDDLIKSLQALDAGDLPVRVALQVPTQAYPSGYFVPTKGAHWFQKAHDGTVRFYIHLGAGFTIRKQKKG